MRSEDPDIVWPIGGIFAYSGGAPVNVDAINAAPVHAVDEDAAGAARWCATSRTSRRATRRTTSTASARRSSTLGGDPKPPPALFQYLADGRTGRRPAHGVDRASTSASTPGYDPTWTWDAATRHVEALDRRRARQIVVGGAQIAPTNVVVQFTQYTGEAEAQTVGEGDVWVFTDGVVRTGRGCAPTRPSPPQLRRRRRPARSCCGPGRTWVELLPGGLRRST